MYFLSPAIGCLANKSKELWRCLHFCSGNHRYLHSIFSIKLPTQFKLIHWFVPYFQIHILELVTKELFLHFLFYYIDVFISSFILGSCQDEEMDIFVVRTNNTKRTFNGDFVAVQNQIRRKNGRYVWETKSISGLKEDFILFFFSLLLL